MNGKRRPVATCLFFCAASLLVRGGNVLWTEAASGEPGEEVLVVVKGSWEEPIRALTVAFSYRSSDLTYLGCDFSFGLGRQTGLVSINDYLEGNALFISVGADPVRGNILPAAQGQEICRLSFRIRSRAYPGATPASIVGRIEGQPWQTVLCDMTSHALHPSIENGSVLIEPPSGPLPPDLFSCIQELASVHLSWENSDLYDELQLLRNGEILSTLSGAATEFEDTLVPQGEYEYELAGLKGGTRSVTVRCRLDVTEPRVEPVEELSCLENEGGVELTWTLPRSYTQIEIRKNGEVLDIIGGESTWYRDIQELEGATLYEVVGYVRDIPSIPIPCVAGAKWTGRLGSVTVRPGGGEVEVPVYLTHPEPIGGMTVGLRFDPALVVAKTHSIRAALLAGRELLRWDVLGSGEARFSFYFCQPACWTMPPAIEACYMKIVCEVAPSVPEGTIIPLQLADQVGSPPLDCCMVPKGARACLPFRKIHGEIVVGSARVKGVADLTARGSKSEGLLSLSWRNGGRYDEIEVERNGALLARLAGDAELFAERVPGPGIYWYRVRGIEAGVASPWKVVLHVFLPGATLFRRGEVNRDSRVDLADAVAICRYLFGGYAIGCQDAADTNDDGTTDLADALYLLSYLFAGTAPPPPPRPSAMWFDPTPDSLTCEK